MITRVLLTQTIPKQTRARQRAERVRGWRSFFSIPVEGARVTVTIAGADHLVTPDRGGVVDVHVVASLEPGWRQIELRTDDTERITASVFVVDPGQRFGIISDVDDTVMVTSFAVRHEFTVQVQTRLRAFLHRLGRDGRQGEVGVVVGGIYYGITRFDPPADPHE